MKCTQNNAATDLSTIVSDEFWHELTQSQREYLRSKPSIADAWRDCWDGELMTLIVQHAADDVIPPWSESEHRKALDRIQRVIDAVAQAVNAGYKELRQLAGELDEEEYGHARSAMLSAADRFRTACLNALHDELVLDAEALAWKYALPEFPDV